MRRAANDEGAVLLTTLLVMSAVAALAVALMQDVGFALRRATTVDDLAQARAYLRGAEDYAVLQVGELARGDLNATLAAPRDFALPIEGGVIALSVRDGSHCASPADALQAGPARRLERTFTAIGVDRGEAARMVAALKDWQDVDDVVTLMGAEDGDYLRLDPPYRTAGSAMTSVGEMRAVRGFAPDVFAMVAPWMCPGPDSPRLNVNTLPVEEAALLGAVIDRDEGFARGLLDTRPMGGWSEAQFNALDGIAPEPGSTEPGVENLDLLAFTPEVVRVDIRVAFRDTTARSALRVGVERGDIRHRTTGEAALARPKFSPDLEAETP